MEIKVLEEKHLQTLWVSNPVGVISCKLMPIRPVREDIQH